MYGNRWISITSKGTGEADLGGRITGSVGILSPVDYWLQISITVEQPAVQRITEAMDGLGAVAVSRQHAGGSARFDTALSDFQGWSTENVSGLFPPDADQKTICNYLHDASGGHTGINCQILADRNWERVSRDQFKPVNVEGDLWICPSWCQPPVPTAVNIIIDPGLAFGTGTHPTTALCLRQLNKIDLSEHTVLDWGCGSGILAIAALKLGALRATATDIDPKALSTTLQNGLNNEIGDQLTVETPEQIVSPMIFDIVIANILAHTLIELAPRLNSLLAADGMVLLSGVLGAQAETVCAAFGPGYTFDTVPADEWILLIGTRTTCRPIKHDV